MAALVVRSALAGAALSFGIFAAWTLFTGDSEPARIGPIVLLLLAAAVVGFASGSALAGLATAPGFIVGAVAGELLFRRNGFLGVGGGSTLAVYACAAVFMAHVIGASGRRLADMVLPTR